MAFDEILSQRLRTALKHRRGVVEQKMFGGIGFLLNGNLLVGIWKNSLVVRIGREAYDDALSEPHVQEFDITGRAMKGWVLIGSEAIVRDEQLKEWIERALKFVKTLPAK